MPTVFSFKQYRFYFYSRETNEPPHVHVEWGDKLKDHELSAVRRLVEEHRDHLLGAWHEYFDTER